MVNANKQPSNVYNTQNNVNYVSGFPPIGSITALKQENPELYNMFIRHMDDANDRMNKEQDNRNRIVQNQSRMVEKQMKDADNRTRELELVSESQKFKKRGQTISTVFLGLLFVAAVISVILGANLIAVLFAIPVVLHMIVPMLITGITGKK